MSKQLWEIIETAILVLSALIDFMILGGLDDA